MTLLISAATLAGSATTEDASPLEAFFGLLMLSAIAGFVLRSWYRSKVASIDAVARAKGLSHDKRDAVERQMLDSVYCGKNHTLSVRELAARVGEHEKYVIHVASSLVKWGHLVVIPLSDDVSDNDFNAYSKVAITAEGEKRLRERDPVVNYHGDYIQVGDNSSVVSKSIVVNSHVGAYERRYGTEVVDALRELERIVRGSGNRDAVEALDEFLAEARAEAPSRTRLRIFFSSMQQLVPTLAGATDLVSRIASIFSP